MRKESVQEEKDYLFNKATRPPIAFNGTAGNVMHENIQRVIQTQRIQVPIIHLETSQYLIGVATNELELKDDGRGKQEVYVVVNKGRQTLQLYCDEHGDQMERTLVHHMHQYDQSLEWVIDQIINGKEIKTETAVEQTPGLLNYTSWVSINLDDRKNKLKTNKKGHIDGRQ